jgi:hypothetical protein
VPPSAPRPHGRGVFASDVAAIHLMWAFAISFCWSVADVTSRAPGAFVLFGDFSWGDWGELLMMGNIQSLDIQVPYEIV